MVSFGIDVGTSKICLVALDERGNLLFSEGVSNTFCAEKRQDVSLILSKCLTLIQKAEEACGKADVIGVSNQMHGILYVDNQGNALSDLYTWQDFSGNLPYTQGRSYAEEIIKKTGYSVRTGYGLVTHFYHVKNGIVPKGAKGIYTIGDFIAMRLNGSNDIKMHPSNAASLGLYKIAEDAFDNVALQTLGIDYELLPEVDYFQQGVIALGDNQASFLGSVKDWEKAFLVNIGTGSQISLVTEKTQTAVGEIRPLFKEKKLQVGAAICGGYAYTLLGRFFLSVANMMGVDFQGDIFSAMNEGMNEQTQTVFDTTFLGSRENTQKRASFYNISENNFTAGDMVLACQRGMIAELYDLYSAFGEGRSLLVGAGNGVKKNPHIKRLLLERFQGCEYEISLVREEAAVGAAIYAIFNAEKVAKANRLQTISQRIH